MKLEKNRQFFFESPTSMLVKVLGDEIQGVHDREHIDALYMGDNYRMLLSDLAVFVTDILCL